MSDQAMLEWAERWHYPYLVLIVDGDEGEIFHGRDQWEQFIANGTPEEKEAAWKRINRWNERVQAA